MSTSAPYLSARLTVAADTPTPRAIWRVEPPPLEGFHVLGAGVSARGARGAAPTVPVLCPFAPLPLVWRTTGARFTRGARGQNRGRAGPCAGTPRARRLGTGVGAPPALGTLERVTGGRSSSRGGVGSLRGFSD
jgi:hypothetical protein